MGKASAKPDRIRGRCAICGWLIAAKECPCGAAEKRASLPALLPIGARVLARPGRGPSMLRWERGEIRGHVGPIHRVETACGTYWCEARDLLSDAAEREALVTPGARVWGLWLDGHWYPGVVDGQEGPLRHVQWDDGDSMWTEARNLVIMAAPAGAPQPGDRVTVDRWDGQRVLATVEEADGGRIRVAFDDGEEAWAQAAEVKAIPPNPFLDPQEEAR